MYFFKKSCVILTLAIGLLINNQSFAMDSEQINQSQVSTEDFLECIKLMVYPPLYEMRQGSLFWVTQKATELEQVFKVALEDISSLKQRQQILEKLLPTTKLCSTACLRNIQDEQKDDPYAISEKRTTAFLSSLNTLQIQTNTLKKAIVDYNEWVTQHPNQIKISSILTWQTLEMAWHGITISWQIARGKNVDDLEKPSCALALQEKRKAIEETIKNILSEDTINRINTERQQS